jgi:hypothetical protein
MQKLFVIASLALLFSVPASAQVNGPNSRGPYHIQKRTDVSPRPLTSQSAGRFDRVLDSGFGASADLLLPPSHPEASIRGQGH